MNFFTPAEVAKNYIATGKSKVNTPIPKMIILAILAGAFIGFGGVGATTVAVSITEPSLGKFIGACVFPGGLTMVLIAGSELFTGNCLLTIPLLEKEITVGGMLKNWVVVYIGNLIGGLLVGAGVAFSHQPSLFNNGMAVSVLSTAASKCSMPFSDAFIKGILCNFLVCIAVWISFAAKEVVSKIIGLFFPIMMFVLCENKCDLCTGCNRCRSRSDESDLGQLLRQKPASGYTWKHCGWSNLRWMCILVYLPAQSKKSCINIKIKFFQ